MGVLSDEGGKIFEEESEHKKWKMAAEKERHGSIMEASGRQKELSDIQIQNARNIQKESKFDRLYDINDKLRDAGLGQIEINHDWSDDEIKENELAANKILSDYNKGKIEKNEALYELNLKEGETDLTNRRINLLKNLYDIRTGPILREMEVLQNKLSRTNAEEQRLKDLTTELSGIDESFRNEISKINPDIRLGVNNTTKDPFNLLDAGLRTQQKTQQETSQGGGQVGGQRPGLAPQYRSRYQEEYGYKQPEELKELGEFTEGGAYINPAIRHIMNNIFRMQNQYQQESPFSELTSKYGAGDVIEMLRGGTGDAIENELNRKRQSLMDSEIYKRIPDYLRNRPLR